MEKETYLMHQSMQLKCKFQPIKENMTAKVHTTELWWEGNSHSNSNERTQLVQIKPLI